MKSLLLSLLVIGAIGCAKKDDSSGGGAGGFADGGVYSKPCDQYDEQSNDYKESISIDSDQFHTYTNNYESTGKTCTGKPSLTIEVSGPYKLAIKSPNSDIDLEMTSVLMTPHNEMYVSFMNANAFCGITNWALDTPQEVMGKKCGNGDPFEPQKFYSIVNITADEIRVGKVDEAHNGKTPETRSVELDPVPYKK